MGKEVNPIPKKRRITDRKYLRWIKQQECLVAKYFRQEWLRAVQDPFEACVLPIDPHHVTPVSLGGSDKTAVPLCRKHHDYAQRGPLTFQKTYGIVFDSEIARLRKEYAALNVKPAKAKKAKATIDARVRRCVCGKTHYLPMNKVSREAVYGSHEDKLTVSVFQKAELLVFRCPLRNEEVKVEA